MIFDSAKVIVGYEVQVMDHRTRAFGQHFSYLSDNEPGSASPDGFVVQG